MKNSLQPLALILLGSALFGWMGWKLGREFRPAVQEQISRSEVSNLGNPEGGARPGEVRGDYEKVISPNWSLRDGSDYASVKARILDAGRIPASVPDATAMGLLGELEPDEAREVLTGLLEFQPRPLKMIGVALARWALGSPRDALAEAERRLQVNEFSEVRGRILEAWASRDPKAAHAWYLEQLNQSPTPLRWKLEQDFNNIIYQWGLRNPQEAVAACSTEERHGTFDGWYGLGHLVNVPAQREELFAAIGGMADASKQKKAWENVLGAWAEVSPRDAGLWLETQPFSRDANMQWRVIERWGRNGDPSEAAEFAIRNSDPGPEGRDKALQMVLPYWSMDDPQAAGDWLEKTGPTTQGISIVANAWVRRDMEKAVDWVMRIPEESRREHMANVLATAKQSRPNFNPADWADRTGVSAEELVKMTEDASRMRMTRF